MKTIHIPDKKISDFINRIFSITNKVPWWENLEGEDRQGKPGRFLSEEFAKELKNDIYYESKTKQTKLFFFSDKTNCAIDGRFKDIGVELKCKDLSFKSLIDGAIHRGLLWVYGNPQMLNSQNIKSISIYVLKKNARSIERKLAKLYFAVLKEISQYGIYIVFVTQQGELWGNFQDSDFNHIPCWLADLDELSINNFPPSTQIIYDSNIFNFFVCPESDYLYSKSRKHMFHYTKNNEHGVTAIMKWGNDMQMLEIGLLLRAKGYNCVKVIYHSSTGRIKKEADHGVENRVKMKMIENHGIHLEWINNK
jgi:hypothetical protein